MFEPVVKEVIVNAPVSRVWKAVTDKEEMKNWYFDIKDFEPVPGFEFQFYGGDETNQYLHLCKVVEVIENKKISYTWRYSHTTGDTLVTFNLSEVNGKTKVKLTHEGFENFPKDRPELKRENFKAGWNEIIGSLLKKYVESPH